MLNEERQGEKEKMVKKEIIKKKAVLFILIL